MGQVIKTLQVPDHTGHTTYEIDTEAEAAVLAEVRAVFENATKGGLVAAINADGTQEKVPTFDEFLNHTAEQAVVVRNLVGG